METQLKRTSRPQWRKAFPIPVPLPQDLLLYSPSPLQRGGRAPSTLFMASNSGLDYCSETLPSFPTICMSRVYFGNGQRNCFGMNISRHIMTYWRSYFHSTHSRPQLQWKQKSSPSVPAAYKINPHLKLSSPLGSFLPIRSES